MSDDLQTADQRAHDEWIDGPGEDCATTTGIWHAAIAYERQRSKQAAIVTLSDLGSLRGKIAGLEADLDEAEAELADLKRERNQLLAISRPDIPFIHGDN